LKCPPDTGAQIVILNVIASPKASPICCRELKTAYAGEVILSVRAALEAMPQKLDMSALVLGHF